MPPSTLTFLGAAGTVTGSKYLVRAGHHQLLLDCGLFQGLKPLRLRNWAAPAFDARAIDAVVLSHAHLDHSGYLPLLAQRGFRGAIHCTAATADLLAVVLTDAAHIQAVDTERANREHFSKHHPALPLFSVEDAENTLRLVERHPFHKVFHPTPTTSSLFRPSGHILGAASVQLDLPDTRVVFSGDLGRWERPIIDDPELVDAADVLLVESTYGDRLHTGDTEAELARAVSETVARGGVVVIPAFAIGRTQELVWLLRRLASAQKIPDVPVFVDSPMAAKVTEVYRRHQADLRLDTFRPGELVETPEASKALNRRPGSFIVIAGSGMATGGRVLHHLKLRLPDARNTVLLSGFQAEGTRGRALQDGATQLKLHGALVPVRAQIGTLTGLSAHADQRDLLRWLRGFAAPPQMTYVVHGEPQSAAQLATCIREQLKWPVTVALDQATVELPRRQ